MRQVRVYSAEPLAPQREHTLSRTATEHVVRVLRLRPGDPLVLFDGCGGEYAARLVRIARSAAVVETGRHLPVERESPLAITLLQGLARGEKMDWIVQKATELGVVRIVPVGTGRSVVRIAGAERADRKLEHWRAVAASACEQCGRNRLPGITAPMRLPAALELVASAGLRLLLAPDAQATPDTSMASLAALARGIDSSVALLIGPEGGFEGEEIEAARHQGFRAARFGPRVLRTETAAIAAIAALQALAGDLG